MNKKIIISDAELKILKTLWAAEQPLNAAQIRSILSENENWERTTVLTLIQRLLKKGVLSQEKREVYYYAPCIKREEYVEEETKNFVKKFYEGSSRNLAAALMDSEALTREDIEELRNYFNQNYKGASRRI